ncbi:hypothetical protein CMI42_01360 [Candidatus Pacearchaeota archaeon]|nr:hypothetical protein [Candidatus Pacearchaeota archaeon]
MKKEVKKILSDQLELVKPSEDTIKKINNIYKDFSKQLKEKIKKKKVKASIFLGGSLAKGSLIKKDLYDIDIFVRFDKKYGDKKISNLLGKTLGKDFRKIHGSRDYYQKTIDGILIEIIPVLKIDKPEESENVTDLSYFHVKYIKDQVSKNKTLINEIMLSKIFTHAQNVYGAESYIHGFSGYALELLICHYKNFTTFIKAISKLNKEKLIIDDGKHYKNKKDLLENINQSKKQGPIIVIDPTYKERNVTSGLSKETLTKFQDACKKFINNPSSNFFIKKDFLKEFQDKDSNILVIETNKQAGDIAGTKSRKFFNFLNQKLSKQFIIKRSEFIYSEEENKSYFYFTLNKKKPTIVKGPPITNTKDIKGFKKSHKKVFTKKGYAYTRIIHNLSFETWFKNFIRKDKKIINEMSIKKIELIS